MRSFGDVIVMLIINATQNTENINVRKERNKITMYYQN